jgi:4-amino-4-deoxy-L-arabinose transferase-like glycosyltransferase
MSNFDRTSGGWKERLWLFGPAVCVYLLATLLTDAWFMADTADYVDSIVAYERGVNYNFWEFAHLIWRPFGWLAFKLFGPGLSYFTNMEGRAGITLVLMALNWLAGLLCVILLVRLLDRLTGRRWVVNVTALAFIFTQGFLNNAQTGSSYIPGLAFLLLGLNLSLEAAGDKKRMWAAIAAGVALSGAVLMWVPYLWAVPGAIALPLLLTEKEQKPWRFALMTGIAFAVFTAIVYLSVLALLGIYSVEGVKAWMAEATHGNRVSGAARVVFGLPRSFINMGKDGMLLKRYLLRDPFNPVSLWDVLRLSIWKAALFYLILCAIALGLWRGQKMKRALAFVVAGCAPVIVFAIFFEGGAIERYLPLYPYLLLGIGFLLASPRAWRPLKYLALVFVAVLLVSNAQALSKSVLNREQEKQAARLEGVLQQLKPESIVYLPNWQDDLVNFGRSFPFHPVNRQPNLRLDALVTPGIAQAALWREGFAKRAEEVWSAGGDVWVSRRVLSERPLAEWNWVEGDEPSVSWADFKRFFSQLKMSEAVGGEDGFMMLVRDEGNASVLRPLAGNLDSNQKGR